MICTDLDSEYLHRTDKLLFPLDTLNRSQINDFQRHLPSYCKRKPIHNSVCDFSSIQFASYQLALNSLPSVQLFKRVSPSRVESLPTGELEECHLDFGRYIPRKGTPCT